ncbi:hypothetical protein Tco_0936445 [Tanacetum coccineum]
MPAVRGPVQPWLSSLAQKEDPRESFNELMDTPLDFSAFVMNRLKVDTLTPELLAGPTFKLMKRSCKSLVELKYLFEEVYKATTDQLDWNNPEECGVKCRLATTNMHYGESHIGGKNDNNSMDLRLTGNLDDDKLYKFKEGNFNKLRIQDIEDMMLLLVQGKLTNLTVKERLAFNDSLQIFTRSIVIQKRMEDLQLGVESYQKKLNLTKPDTYRPDLKRREAYTAYSNPRGFIYQNKDKKDRLMRIDELHKFSDGAMIQEIDKQLKRRKIMGSLEKFVGERPYEEHAEFDESDTHVLERFKTLAGNPVKEILLKLNLPDHKILKDGGEVHHNVYSPSSSIPQLEYSPTVNQQSEFPQLDSDLTIPVFKHDDDPINAINHVMSFLSAIVTSRYPTTNNQLRNSSNLRQQATINDGRVTVQPPQGRQISYVVGTTRTFTPGASGSNSGKQRIVTCYNCKGEGHMSKQCTKPRRKRDDKSVVLVRNASK